MYIPSDFEQTQVPILHELIRAYPFGALVCATPDGVDANHLPFLLDSVPTPLGTLYSHVSRSNPLWRTFAPDTEALVIFQGPNSYVSPSWYSTKKQTSRVVPTWNYVAVHARGPVRVIEDRERLRGFLDAITSRHEAGTREPWEVADAPPEYIDKLLDAIVGVEIPIAGLVGKWKVSQNRTELDRSGVVNGLLQAGTDTALAMAEQVRNWPRSE